MSSSQLTHIFQRGRYTTNHHWYSTIGYNWDTPPRICQRIPWDDRWPQRRLVWSSRARQRCRPCGRRFEEILREFGENMGLYHLYNMYMYIYIYIYLYIVYIFRHPDLSSTGGFIKYDYHLVNVYIAIENHHLLWVNQLFLWPFSTATLNHQRVWMNMGQWVMYGWNGWYQNKLGSNIKHIGTSSANSWI